MYQLTVFLGQNNDSAPTKAIAMLADDIGRKVGNTALKQGREVAEVVADALKAEFAPEKFPITVGDRALTLVLRFDTEQVVAIPLRLTDRDFVGSEISLKGAELVESRLVVEDGGEMPCRKKHNFHKVTLAVRTEANGRILASCSRCGDKIECHLDKPFTDIDSLLATAAAADIVVSGDADVEAVARIDKLRRRLAARQSEIADAQRSLDAAASVIAQKMLELAPEC